MNIAIKSTNFSQQVNNKPAFKSKSPMVKDAVELMANVRSSYDKFEPNILHRVIGNMRQKLNAILNHQKETGTPILMDADVKAVEDKISSLKRLAISKFDVSA